MLGKKQNNKRKYAVLAIVCIFAFMFQLTAACDSWIDPDGFDPTGGRGLTDKQVIAYFHDNPTYDVKPLSAAPDVKAEAGSSASFDAAVPDTVEGFSGTEKGDAIPDAPDNGDVQAASAGTAGDAPVVLSAPSDGGLVVDEEAPASDVSDEAIIGGADDTQVMLLAAPDGEASENEEDGAPDIAAAPEAQDEAEDLGAPENEVLLVAEAPENAETGEETFTGNAIGNRLNKTFYKFDYAIFTLFSKLHNAALTTFFNLYTHLGDTEFAIPMLVLGLILSLFKKTRKYGITLFVAIVIGTLFTNVVLKNVCGRPRPYVTLSGDADFMSWYTRVGSNIESDNSFPSGHTTCAFEIATALFLTVKNRKIKWIFPVYAILIMCSRVYLMVHYPTDVLTGVIVGICAGVLGYVICKKLMNVKFIDNFDAGEFFKKLKNK